MKIHLAWIRVTATAALVASVGVHPASAQYAPFKPLPPDPVAPAATAPATPYVAYRTPAAYPQATAGRFQPPAQAYQAPTAAYQAPVTPVAPYQPAAQYQAPAPQYAQPQVAYPQTAARYPAAYPYVANAQPTEALPAPQAPSTSAPVMESVPAPVEQGAPPAASAAPMTSGYPAAGCNCGNGSYQGNCYSTGGCGTSYPEVSGYFGECNNENQWFGGVYWLFMTRDRPRGQLLTTEVDWSTAPDPYYPSKAGAVLCSNMAEYDFRSGVEVRLGSTFTVGESCGSGCGYNGCGYGYNGCGCNSCAPSCGTMYAWEVAWWGIDDSPFVKTVDEMPGMRMYGMKNFVGLEYDRDAGGMYNYRPLNDYYGYSMPIDMPGAPMAGDIRVLSQRLYTNFKAQNLELNLMRFPCDVCTSSCNSGCGYDACGCGAGACGGCDSGCGGSDLSMYGSCGVRYFRIDDDFGYDTEFAYYDGTSWDHTMPDWSTFDDEKIGYDINVDNNLIGPQLGWTTNYCVGCKWNFFLNSTFGIFDNHVNVRQRVWTGGDGTIRYTSTGDDMNFKESKDRIAFLGELRVGGSYDFTCHWRAVAAYRAIAATGIATTDGQLPSNFSDQNAVHEINADSSMIIHGVQVGAECRY
ncbi:MAG: BBP7 family outer membrane beta-barrel protein [Pirellulales bacterium]